MAAAVVVGALASAGAWRMMGGAASTAAEVAILAPASSGTVGDERHAPGESASSIRVPDEPKATAPDATSSSPALGRLSDASGDVVAPIDEPSLMTQLREVQDRDVRRTIELAREGNQRFPNSADAPERTAALIHALATDGRSFEARGEAEDMVNRYPDSRWVREIEGFTGAHRHRNIRVRSDGQLEYY